jgi:mono/diheme cytochrome c family protein
MAERRRVLLTLAALGLVLVVGGLATAVYDALYRPEPPLRLASDEDHFLFGSIGNERDEGVPYWIWLVLPRIFPEHLPAPGGYASLGLLTLDGREMPVGLSKVSIGVPRVAMNCAFCHTTSVRTSAGGPRTIITAGAANVTAVQQYRDFLVASASDPRFTAGAILGEISRNYRLSVFERLLYRFVVIPETKKTLVALGRRADAAGLPPGRGRADLMRAFKVHGAGSPITVLARALSDSPPLWNLSGERAFYWSGLTTSAEDAVRVAAVASGSRSEWLDEQMYRWEREEQQARSSLRRMYTYLRSMPSPKWPLPIDRALATDGEAVYRATCAECHDADGARTGSVIPIDEIGTDAARLNAWTESDATAANELGGGRWWSNTSFRRTGGYVAPPLTGVWATAPYLHNGSVPTLLDLLQPVGSRPKTFWRGSDLLDAEKVGFVTDGHGIEATGSRFDTQLPGDSNAGHTYGTDLDEGEKRALVEYMKQF